MQRIVVFQQRGNGEFKIRALTARGRGIVIERVYSIDEPLPVVLEESEGFLPAELEADLALSFLEHPDLAHDLALLCRRSGVPVVASGRRIGVDGAICPPT